MEGFFFNALGLYLDKRSEEKIEINTEEQKHKSINLNRQGNLK